jgi:hypothetical protein
VAASVRSRLHASRTRSRRSRLHMLALKGVKTRSYSGCGSVVLVEATAKAIAALDITAG